MAHYHALARILGGHQAWRNMSWSDLIRDVLVPFVNHQVSPGVSYGNTDAVMNLGTVTYLRIFRTAELLPTNRDPIDQLVSGELAKYECSEKVLKQAHLDRAWPRARSVLEATLAPTQHRVFVVMKFGDGELDRIYQDVMKPVIKTHGFDVLRIDEVEDSESITEQVLNALITSELVLCDLTDERPNCYYETGFAHALGRELILTIRAGQKLHFDLASHRFIRWTDGENLRGQLDKRLQAIVSRQATFSDEPADPR